MFVNCSKNIDLEFHNPKEDKFFTLEEVLWHIPYVNISKAYPERDENYIEFLFDVLGLYVRYSGMKWIWKIWAKFWIN